jgi:hypothetical protein
VTADFAVRRVSRRAAATADAASEVPAYIFPTKGRLFATRPSMLRSLDSSTA